jgi:guanylate kinase
MRNILFVISGPSGVGKGTIAKLLVNRNENIVLSISCTTRKPRANEVDGKDYFFIDKSEFLSKIENDGFLEYSNHFDNYYGTPKKEILAKLADKDVILEIDVNGGLSVKKNFPEAVLIMIAPPSVEAVKERLLKRNTETLDKIEKRLSRLEYELEKQKYYDYTVVNDNLDSAVLEVKEIIKKEKSK